MQSIEVLNSLKVIEEHGPINIIHKGERVTCHLKGEDKCYIGEVVQIGTWKQYDGTYGDVLLMLTDGGNVLSYHIIKVSEIKEIHRS